MTEFPALEALKTRPKEPDESDRGIAADVPVQLAGGFRDAIQNVLDLTGGMAEWLEKRIPLGSIGSSGYSKEFGTIQLPEVDEADTTTGGLVRGATQFATGFIPIFKGLQAAGMATKVTSAANAARLSPTLAKALGIVATSESAALIADQIVFNPYEDRLSNLIEQFPSLQNPITGYLAADQSDTQAEARLKVALEGAGLGLVVSPLVPIFRRMKGRKAGRDLDAAFDAAKKAEEARISKATAEAASTIDPEDILKETPQGQRPYINNKYLDTPEEIINTLNATTDLLGRQMDEARRGVQSTKQTRLLADEMGMTVEDLTRRRKGEAFNAEQALAARGLLNQSAENLNNLAKLAADPATNSEAVQYGFKKAMARHAAIQEQVMGIAAEAGRALRQFQIPAGTPDKAQAIRNIIKEFGAGVDPQKLADMVAKLDTPEGLARFAREVHKPTWKDKALEFWINSLLSGPATQAVNITSNTLVSMWTIPETFTASLLGTFRRSDRVYMREAAERAFGFVQGARDGLRLAYKTFITEEPSDALTKIETSRYQSIPSWTFREGAEKKVFGGIPIPFSGQIEIGGKQARIPGRLLQAGDEFFKAIGYRQELNARALRSGLDEGLSGDELARHIKQVVDNPPENLSLAATRNSRYQTFTNELGETGRSLQGFAASHPGAKIIMPFIRTPVNIVKFAGARSPFGYFMQSVKADMRRGGAARDMARARIYMGTAVGATVASMAMEGHITGGGPQDPALRSALYNSGWQPYSVKIKDKYYSYSRLEPLGMLFGVSADFAEIAQLADGVEADEVGGMIVGSIAKNLTSKTWLRGASELVMAIEDPDRYGAQYIKRLAGTVVPTGLAQAARVEDPILRQAGDIVEQIQSRIPGASKGLLPVRNVWGEPIELSGALGPDIVSPVYVSTLNNDPVAREVARLKMSLQKPERDIKGVKLTEEQYDRYVHTSGSLAKQMVNKYVTSPKWQALPDHLKKDLINGALRRSRRIARTRMLPELGEQIAEQKRAELAN